jgi:hypothetical protein
MCWHKLVNIVVIIFFSQWEQYLWKKKFIIIIMIINGEIKVITNTIVRLVLVMNYQMITKIV